MAYIGKQPSTKFSASAKIDTFTGDGSTVAFDVANIIPAGGENGIQVYVNNVRQKPGSSNAYTIGNDGSGDLKRITFTAAPDADAEVYVITPFEATNIQNVPDGIVTTAKIADDAITPAKIGTSAVTALTAGTGITNGTGTIYRSDVQKLGNIIHTRILIDLTGLASSGNGDVIGKAATANSHIGQITTAVNGTVLGGRITCFEAPAGGDPDINLWYADEATGAEDAAITSLTNQVQMCDSGDFAIGTVVGIPTPPAADKYLYMVTGAATDGNYSAGKLLIELFGYV